MFSLGDRAEDSVIDFKWNSNAAAGGSITLATNGTVCVYKGSNTAESTAGITLTEDFDGKTGIHHITLDLSADAFYAIGEDYQIVSHGMTIDGQTVNVCLAVFTIEKGFYEVDVTKFNGVAATSSGGRPEVDTTHWKGTALAATDTAGYPKVTVKSGTGTGELSLSSGQVILQSGTGTGQLDFTTGIVKSNVTEIVGGAQSAIDLGDFVDNGYDPGTNRVNANVETWLGVAVSTNGDMEPTINCTKIGFWGITTDSIGPAGINDIAGAVWDADATAHQTQGTFGRTIGDQGADSDSIWSLVNTNLDAPVSTRLAPTVADRTLDVTATGAAGIDWGNVENQSTIVDLSATNIDTDQQVASVSGSVGSVAGNVGGNVIGSTGSVVGNVGGSVGSISGITFPSNFSLLSINGSGSITRVVTVDSVTDIADGAINDASFTLPAEPTSAPTTFFGKFLWAMATMLNARGRNSAGHVTVRNNADNADLFEYDMSDDGSGNASITKAA